jgi:hypothetical protein
MQSFVVAPHRGFFVEPLHIVLLLPYLGADPASVPNHSHELFLGW